MTRDTNPHDGVSPLLNLSRRRILKAAGVGLAATSIGGVGTASGAGHLPYQGPFHRSYTGEMVVPSEIGTVTTDDPSSLPGGGGDGDSASNVPLDSGEKEEEELEFVPRKSPVADGKITGGGGGPVQTMATEADLVDFAFDGLGADDVRGVVPSDNQVAVGDEYVLNVVNSRIALFDKEGDFQWQFTLDDWWQNVSPIIYEEEAEDDGTPADFFDDYIIFDPRARYDNDAGQFVMLCVEYSLNTGIGAFLLSVTADGDPNGTWYNYHIPAVVRDDEENVPGLVDFPELGYDDEAIYLTQNFFDPGFSGATLVALDKEGAYSGSTSGNHFTDLQNPDGSLAFTVQPASAHGSEAGYFVNSKFFQGKTLTVWQIENGFGEDPTLENAGVRVRPYHNAPAAEQPDTEEKIDPIDTRIQRVSFDGNYLWATHTVNDGRVRWYHIEPDRNGTGPAVLHSGNFKRHGRSTYMPAIESDNDGNVVLVYNSSSGNGQNGYVGAEVATVDADEVSAFEEYQAGMDDYDYQDGEAGEPDTGPQVMRWGDYNGIEVDPDGNFWFTAQYTPAPQEGLEEYLADNFYATRIGKIELAED